MSRGWEYHLATGSSLRQHINDGEETLKSCINTLIALEKCYSEIKGKVAADDWEDISGEWENVKEHIEILKTDDEVERIDHLLDLGFDGFNPPLDMVNEDLLIFYNVCDELRIWIGI